jgi:DNA-binding NarL/FixJ family response regulator
MKAKTHTILFVDDEPTLTEPLRLLMEAKGFNCVSRTDMTSAMIFLRSNQVSVLVTDIMMPSGDEFPEIDSSETGMHFVSKVRDEYPDIRIICLSVIGEQSKIQELKSQGALYLRKGETPLDTAASLIESKATGIISY